VAKNREVPRLFSVLLQHPRLFWGWLRFASQLMPGGTLDRVDTELTILRVAWNCRCRYEWGQHVLIALAVGVLPEQIVRVALGPQAEGWSPRHAAMLRAADEQFACGVVGDATWRELEAHYAQKQLLELLLLIGHYQMLAGFIHSLGLTLEPDVEQALAHAPIHDGPMPDAERTGVSVDDIR
jgi:alkylhydroperoxidase family enzyme